MCGGYHLLVLSIEIPYWMIKLKKSTEMSAFQLEMCVFSTRNECLLHFDMHKTADFPLKYLGNWCLSRKTYEMHVFWLEDRH